jgi:large subunit ribosomal protein L35Ae
MDRIYRGLILGYRRGLKSQRPKECLIKVLGEGKSTSNRLVGWEVSWPLDNPKIRGRIVRPHGRSGTLRVRFSRGLPGQAIGTRVRIHKGD